MKSEKDKIKMRVNQNVISECQFCNATWPNVAEMYDIALLDQKFTICRECSHVLFTKLLRASCLYDGKVKTKEDLQRAQHDKGSRWHSFGVGLK